MQQVVQAARPCCEHGVLHCDFEQNLLIYPDTLEVKLVDFGCAEVMTDELYTDFPGNPAFSPEWVRYKKYFGFPTLSWAVESCPLAMKRRLFRDICHSFLIYLMSAVTWYSSA